MTMTAATPTWPLTADVSVTRGMLRLLSPLITPRAPYLLGIASGRLRTLTAAVAATQVSGRWVAVEALPATQRRRVDAAIGAALETLARVPDLLALGGT